MSDYCPTCRHSTWSLMGAPHVCQAKWRVWNPDFGQEAEDGPTIYARDAESAAAEGAERMDMDGDPLTRTWFLVYVSACLEKAFTVWVGGGR